MAYVASASVAIGGLFWPMLSSEMSVLPARLLGAAIILAENGAWIRVHSQLSELKISPNVADFATLAGFVVRRLQPRLVSVIIGVDTTLAERSLMRHEVHQTGYGRYVS